MPRHVRFLLLIPTIASLAGCADHLPSAPRSVRGEPAAPAADVGFAALSYARLWFTDRVISNEVVVSGAVYSTAGPQSPSPRPGYRPYGEVTFSGTWSGGGSGGSINPGTPAAQGDFLTLLDASAAGYWTHTPASATVVFPTTCGGRIDAQSQNAVYWRSPYVGGPLGTYPIWSGPKSAEFPQISCSDECENASLTMPAGRTAGGTPAVASGLRRVGNTKTVVGNCNPGPLGPGGGSGPPTGNGGSWVVVTECHGYFLYQDGVLVDVVVEACSSYTV